MGPVPLYKLKRLLTRNLALKLICLAVAFVTWSISAVSRRAETNLVLPVKVQNVPAGFIPRLAPPERVSFIIAGPLILIDGARRSNTALNLSLDGAARPGNTVFTHLDTMLKLPEGIKVVRVSPASLEVTLIPDHLQQGEQQ